MSNSAGAARLRSAEQRQAEMAWERAQEQGMQAFRAGRSSEAFAHWAKGLEIAERHFERGDPRLAASFTNRGYALLRQDHIHQANTYFESAMAAWDDSWRWVPWMTPSPEPGGNRPEPYDHVTQQAFYGLIQRGRAVTEAIWQDHKVPEAFGDDWHTVKPKSMNDIRRLFSAVYLMPTARSKRAGSGDRAA